MKGSKMSLALLLVLLFNVLSTGCVSKKTTTSNSSTVITITDSAGRNVTLYKSPKRVIVLTSYWAEVLHCLGLDDRIVGIGTISYDRHIPEDVRKKTIVGSMFKGLNWETVVGLKPDLIIADWYGGRYGDKKIIEKAQELGIPVIALQAKTIEDNIKIIKLLGKVFKKEEKARELSGWMQKKLDNVKRIANQIPADKRRNIILISVPKDISGPISIASRESAYASMVELVGAHNLAFDRNFSTPWPKLDLEKFIAYWGDKADIIVVVSYSQEKLEKSVSEIKNDPRWREIKAVKEGHVYGILAGSNGFLDWGPRAIAGVYQMGKLIYPGYYPNWKPIKKELLQKFYGEGFYRTIIDTEGRKVKVPLKVDRVAVLAGQVAELMYCWGDFDKVVGITEWAKWNPILVKLTNVREIPVVGSGRSPNVEAIISLKPDVVITYGGEYGYSTPKSVIDQLEEAGIPVVLVELNNLDGVYRSIEIVGEILNEENKANETINQMKKIIALVKNEASKIPKEKRIKAIWLWGEPTRVTGNSGVTNDLIINAGAINPASEVKGNYVSVPLEKIITWNPDVIIIWDYPKYQPEDLINDPKRQDISAIKNKRVYKQPRLLGDTWSIRVAVLQAWMFDKFYPGRIDFNSIANEFFKEFYGISYSEVER
ncbi:MAG: ABC transporter substrate-binding protein [Nitrospiraceae bacterium]|nr:ABC transporter substrate-binding protein [Nitrospiraceae bacterium]